MVMQKTQTAKTPLPLSLVDNNFWVLIGDGAYPWQRKKLQRILREFVANMESVLRAGGTALETGSQREASCREGSSIAAWLMPRTNEIPSLETEGKCFYPLQFPLNLWFNNCYEIQPEYQPEFFLYAGKLGWMTGPLVNQRTHYFPKIKYIIKSTWSTHH